MAQWLGFGAFPDLAPVQTLLRELRSLKLHGTATNKQKRSKKASLGPMHVQRASVSRGDYPGRVSGPTVTGAASALSSRSPLGAALRQGSRDSGT